MNGERDDLAELSAFATVTEERSFNRAAARLRLSQSVLSHAMRGLERRMGVQLLARTTRSVAATAGRRFTRGARRCARKDWTCGGCNDAASRAAGGQNQAGYSEIGCGDGADAAVSKVRASLSGDRLEVTSSNDPVDLVAGEYDAGVQLGEYIQRDMIAVRVTREMRLAVVGSPAYFKANNIPRHPQDLKGSLLHRFQVYERAVPVGV